jgi:hypothetical protein
MSKSRGNDSDEQAYDPDDDKPMNEAQWEAFMREGDLRAARFGELLETLMDHPNRDEIVAREMGWDEIADGLAEEKQLHGAGETDGEGWKGEGASEDDADEGADDAASDSDGSESDDPPPRRRRRRGLRASGSDPDPFEEPVPSPEELAAMPEDEWPVEAIPAYNLAFEVGMRVWDALKPWSELRAEEDDEVGEKVGEAFIGSQISAAKLAGGHGMGYDERSICGNIVCCKKGLAGAEQTEQALLWLADEGTLPREKVDLLLPDVKKVQEAIRQRIAELRKRVWW